MDAAASELERGARRRLRILRWALASMVVVTLASILASVIVIPTIIQDVSAAACVISAFAFAGTVAGIAMMVPRIRTQKKLLKDCAPFVRRRRPERSARALADNPMTGWSLAQMPQFFSTGRMQYILRRHRVVVVFLRMLLPLAVLASLAIAAIWIYWFITNPPQGIEGWLGISLEWLAYSTAAPAALALLLYVRWRGRIQLLNFCVANGFQYAPRLSQPQLASIRDFPLIAGAWHSNPRATEVAVGHWQGRDVLLMNFSFDQGPRQTLAIAAATGTSSSTPFRVHIPNLVSSQSWEEEDPYVEMAGNLVMLYWRDFVWLEWDATFVERLSKALQFVEAWEQSRGETSFTMMAKTPPSN